MQINECFDKLILWAKTGVWIHNDTANNVMRDYFLKHVGNEQALNDIIKTSCSSCNKWKTIYQLNYNHFKNNS